MAALGIGANTAVFSIVHHLLLAPLPFPDGNRMVSLALTTGAGEFSVEPRQDVVDAWTRTTRAVEQITPYSVRGAILGDTAADAPVHVQAIAAVPSMLSYVHAHPVLGRGIGPTDTLAGATPVAIISDSLWRHAFGGTEAVLGRIVVVNGISHRIIGVLPRSFSVPFTNGDPAVVTALAHTSGTRPVEALAKLRPGASTSDANRELASIVKALRLTDGHDNAIDGARVDRAVDLVSSDERQVVLVLFGAVGFVLLIACANIAQLLLTRAWGRQREFAVRLALGAGRARIVRQVLAESLTLSLAGAVAGIAVAAAAIRLIVAAQPPYTDYSGARLEPGVLAWTVGVALITGLLFGCAPAFFAGRERVAESLKASTRLASGTRAARRLRTGLVTLEVALSVVLLCGAGLLVRTLIALQRDELGFAPRGLSGMSIVLDGPRFADESARRSAMNALLQRARETPGVLKASIAFGLPPDALIALGGLEIEGRPLTKGDSVRTLALQVATPDYFETAGIPILRGRTFAAAPGASAPGASPPPPQARMTKRGAELVPRAPIVAGDESVIGESLARRFWPNGDAVGARIRIGRMPWTRVVGIVPDVHAPGALGGRDAMQVYQPLGPGARNATLIVRSPLAPADLEAKLRAAAHSAAPTIRLRGGLTSAEMRISGAMSTQRFTLVLLGGFALLAVVLAVIGLYGVIVYSVTQRTRELGVRMALGATPRDVLSFIAREGLVLSVGGVGVGAVAAIGTTRALRGLLFGVQPGDPATILLVSLLIGAVGLLSTLVPARRATRIDPVEALRAE